MRLDHDVFAKIVDSFVVIGKELSSSSVLAEKPYYMDEMGVRLRIFGVL